MLCYVCDFNAKGWEREGGGVSFYFHAILFIRYDYVYRVKWFVVFVASYAKMRKMAINAITPHQAANTKSNRQIDIWPHLTIKNYRSNSIQFRIA